MIYRPIFTSKARQRGGKQYCANVRRVSVSTTVVDACETLSCTPPHKLSVP